MWRQWNRPVRTLRSRTGQAHRYQAGAKYDNNLPEYEQQLSRFVLNFLQKREARSRFDCFIFCFRPGSFVQFHITAPPSFFCFCQTKPNAMQSRSRSKTCVNQTVNTGARGPQRICSGTVQTRVENFIALFYFQHCLSHRRSQIIPKPKDKVIYPSSIS